MIDPETLAELEHQSAEALLRGGQTFVTILRRELNALIAEAKANAELRRERQEIQDQLDDERLLNDGYKADRAERDRLRAQVARLTEALEKAHRAVLGMVDQQAMPDPWWVPVVATIEAALREA